MVTPGDIITPLPPDGAVSAGESTISASPAPDVSVSDASVPEPPDEDEYECPLSSVYLPLSSSGTIMLPYEVW